MFLIRTVFWVSLVILMLPVGGNNSSNIVGATKYAFQDMDKFCDRNIDICNISAETWKSLKYKAAYSFDVVASIAKDIKQAGAREYSPVYKAQKSTWETGSLNKSKAQSSEKITASQNTLRGDDLKPTWSLKSDKI